MKTKSLYGFSPELEPFVGKTAAEQVALLRAWGNTAIFGGYQNPEFIAAAHHAGIKIFAEFGCFVHKKWWEDVPHSRPLTDDGNWLAPEEWYHGVNPTTPLVRQKQLGALEKLLSDYPLDGVWLDFIRWPCHWESPDPHLPRTSFDAHTLGLFKNDTGIEIPTQDPTAAARQLLNQHEVEWTSWRCEQVTSWVVQAKEVLRRTRPNALLGLFGVPWRLSDHGGAILNIIGQDYAALGQHVDVISPMVYHAMCGQSIDWIGEVCSEIKTLSDRPVWPIIQSVDEPRALPADEYGAALDVTLRHPASDGALVFTLKGALEAAKLAVTKAHFARLA